MEVRVSINLYSAYAKRKAEYFESIGITEKEAIEILRQRQKELTIGIKIVRFIRKVLSEILWRINDKTKRGN